LGPWWDADGGSSTRRVNMLDGTLKLLWLAYLLATLIAMALKDRVL
jgi:hypothetical protein